MKNLQRLSWLSTLPRKKLIECEQRLRTQARNDPARFVAICLAGIHRWPDELPELHCELQEFLSHHDRALIELPRDHGKSTQVCARLIWELARNPSLRIKIVCANEALAVERGRFLRDAIAQNLRIRWVFPQFRPAQPWEAMRFTVARPQSVIGPSVAAFGIGASSTGARADLLVCDDIVDVKALRSKSDRERVRIYFQENLVNLLEPDGRLWCLFTPWHTDDLNSRLKSNPEYAHFRRAIDADLTPIWPEHWPRERLDQRRREIGELSFARAYRLICLSDDELAIRADWVQFWTEPTNYEAKVLAIDPAISASAKADASALVVLARTIENRIHCLEAIARRANAPALVQLIDDFDRRWRPDAILFESNAAFAAVRDLLIRHARFGPKIQSVVQTRDKSARVRVFSVSVQNGSFRLAGKPTGGVTPGQQELFDEMTTFPGGEHDDLLDAAAFGTEWLLNRPEPRVW
jgi:predicted phage terminase large subunit-like protein